MTEMTSRQRLLAALDHREPDRVPIDLGGNQTGIHKLAYQALVERLGLDESIEILDPVQQLAQPSETILERLRVDTRYIRAGAAEGFQRQHCDCRAQRKALARPDRRVWSALVDA